MGTDQRLKLVIGGAVVLLVLITLATFFFISRAKQTETTSNASLDSLSSLRVTVTPTEATPEAPVLDSSTTKLYQGTGFALRYPKDWGLLSCSNSANFELDPKVGADAKVACDRALKPITFLVTPNLNCKGDLVVLGSHQVLKSKVTLDRDTDYQWCVSLGSGQALDITHRVSQTGSRATSSVDYSPQIEEIIKSITATPRGS